MALDADVGAAAAYRDLEQDPFPTYAVAPSFATGDLVALARHFGSTYATRGGPLTEMRLTGECIARVSSDPGTGPLASIDVELIDVPDMSAEPGAVHALRRHALERARTDETFLGHLAERHFLLEQLSAIQSPEAITAWMLWHLQMPFTTRVACYASSLAQRLKTLETLLG